MQILKTSKARENILSRIRKGLSEEKLPIPFPEVEKDNQPIYTTDGSPIDEQFAEAFMALGGKFVFCGNEQELMQNLVLLYENNGWQSMLCADEHLLSLFRNNRIDIVQSAEPYREDADACITDCEMLVCRTGSVLFSSNQHLGRTAPVFYPVHIIIAYADQIVGDIDEAFVILKRKYNNNLPSMINLATGPSRTADIEKTLVVGVHGPGEVYCFFVNTNSGFPYK